MAGRHSDRIGSTAFIAALAHGLVILGVTFTAEPPPESAELPSLNVTLVVDSASAEAHAEQALLANRDSGGGGRIDEDARATTALAADHPLTRPGDPIGADPTDGRPREQAAELDRVATRDNPDRRIQAVPNATERASDAPQRAATLISDPARRTSVAEIDARAAQPEADRPDEAPGPATRESAIAGYLVHWRQRVERIGTANFPARFRNGAPGIGRPILEVAISRNGQLADIVVRTSSGDTSLDQAALNILRLAAPFDPLPDAILAEHEELRFAYEWDFSTGG